MSDLFDVTIRSMRRDRAARCGPELFLYDRAFEDCLERLAMTGPFEKALLIGCPNPAWVKRLGRIAASVEVKDPGRLFADHARGTILEEDDWDPPRGAYDLVVMIGTLDTINNLPLALHLILRSMTPNALLIGASSGGDTLPQLRKAMRSADSRAGAAFPHVHPRIEASALALLFEQAGLLRPVIDIDRIAVSYPSLDRLVSDLRAMGATNILTARPRFISRRARTAAMESFNQAGDGRRTIETFEILHFAAWSKK